MIAILGAGSLGRLWAASLPPDTTAFVPRPGHPGAGTVEFCVQDLAGREHPVTIPWLNSGHKVDLVLVTTKARDSLQALAGFLPQLPETIPLVLFQNGLGSQQAVAQRWPQRPVLAASTTEGANRPAPDRLIHAGTGDTWIGALTDPARNLVETVVNRLDDSNLKIHPEADILGRLWQKLVINAGINPFTAILDCPNGAILNAEFYQTLIDPLCTEIAGVMAAAGLGNFAPDSLRQTIETVARNTAGNTSSMRSDVQQGRLTEIDYINGYLVKLGEHHGVATPVNRTLTEKVRQLTANQQEPDHG